MENIRNEQFYDDNGNFMDIYAFLRIDPNTTTDEVLRQINDVKGYLRADSLSDDELTQEQIKALDYFERIFIIDRESYDAEYANAMAAAAPVQEPEFAPAPAPAPAKGRELSQEEIERLLGGSAPVQPAEPAAPAQPAEPVAPVQPAESAAPAQPAEPVAPAQPAAPVQEARGYTPEEISALINAAIGQAMAQYTTSPAAPAAPVQPAEPVAPAQPAEPAAPAQPAEPAAPAQPAEPAAPAQPTEPATPAQPTEPAAPVQPTEPATPAQPTEPAAPAQPGEPATPAQPTEPAAPTQPGEPATPAQPGEPVDPNAEDYETLEARTRAAFDREQDEKIKKLKEQAEEQRKQAEERVNTANETVDKAKATKEKEKDEAKRAKEAVKEAKKEARRAKWDAFKAKRAEKKAKKEIEKINKKRQKRKVLIRQPKGGIIVGLKEHWKQIAAGVGATAVLVGGGFAVKHFILDADLGNKDNTPGTEQSGTLNPSGTTTPTGPMTPEQIQNVVDENLDNLDLEEGYTTEDATELVKFLTGQESTLTIDQANDMLEDIVSSVVTPAINNALVGEQVYETQAINLASLLANDPAYEAIQDMEDYINGSIEKPENLAFHAKNALEDQVRAINLGQTVEGFNLTSSSPAARLIWANLAAGMNGLSGTLGEDFTVEIEGVTYAHSEINNGTILQMVINGAKKDFGLDAKTIGQK